VPNIHCRAGGAEKNWLVRKTAVNFAVARLRLKVVQTAELIKVSNLSRFVALGEAVFQELAMRKLDCTWLDPKMMNPISKSESTNPIGQR